MSSVSSTSSSSSSGPSSSPLATYSVNRSYAHLPNKNTLFPLDYGGRYAKPHSRLLQALNTALNRLATGCTFCWATGNPNPASHQYHSCPIVNHSSSNFREAHHDFRGGIRVPAESKACYGCYIPKVSVPRALLTTVLTLQQTHYSDSSNRASLLGHTDWSQKCKYHTTMPIVISVVSSQDDLLQKFRESPQCCCGLDFDRGADAGYVPWLFRTCDKMSPLHHILRVLEFLINLRGMPKAR